MIFLLKFLLNALQNRLFLLWRRDPVLELQNRSNLWAIVHSSIVLCNLVSADRSGMAASRLHLAAAACVILLRFAAESRKSHCNGSVKRVERLFTNIFLDFGTNYFPFKIPFEMRSALRRDPVLELQNRSNLWAVVHSSIGFCNSVSADRSGMAVSRLLLAAAACVILLRFCSWKS